MTAPAEPAAVGWRERKKARTRAAIQEAALRLFVGQGYEATTVEQVSAAAGVSHMTFFRYFPTKESVVESDDYDPLITELIAHRPATEDPLTALHAALRHGLAAVLPTDREALLIRTRLVLSTPALRARNAENQYATQQMFADVLAAREGHDRSSLRINVLAAAALAAFTTALTAWVDGEGADDLVGLVDAAFDALRSATAQPVASKSRAAGSTPSRASSQRLTSMPPPKPPSPPAAMPTLPGRRSAIQRLSGLLWPISRRS